MPTRKVAIRKRAPKPGQAVKQHTNRKHPSGSRKKRCDQFEQMDGAESFYFKKA